ncbi:MAG: discoidin domain-containing protein, partial [Bacteroidales bacterium]|nr:discoidin domain-containing protein [Bacteroidales bacterium]
MKKILLLAVAMIFATANTFADYCAGSAPNSGGGNYYATNKVVAKVNGAEAFTWESNGQNVQDASSACSMSIKAGDMITLVVSSITGEGGVHSSWGTTVFYFDWNQNQDWTDSGEEYVLYDNPGTAQIDKEFTVTVPSNFTWTASELKIRMNSGEAPQYNSYGNATPCQALSRGLISTFKAVPAVSISERTIKFQASPSNAGTLSNTQETSSEAITCTATPSDGYAFVNWTLNGVEVSTLPTISDNSDGDKTYVANFQRDPKLDRTGWTVTASSQEASGEGAGNGVASCIVDDNLGTFWHSQWQGTEPGYPHWFMIDMKSSKSFDAFEYVSRGTGTSDAGENNGNILNYQIYVSDTEIDPNNLPTAVATGSFSYDGSRNHKVNLGKSVKGRYVMLYTTGQSANGRKNASCSEFYLYSSSFTVSVSAADPTMGSAYIGTEGTTSISCSSDGTETATLTAVPVAGYEFVNWTLNGTEVSTDAVYTTTAVTESRSYVANFKFKPVDPREVKVASNDATKGTAMIISPATEGTSVVTGEMVTVKAVVNGNDNIFVNWTINGEEVSTDETFTYSGAAAVTLQANFSTQYLITINETSGGSLTVKKGATTLNSGDRVGAGTTLTITAKGSGSNWVKSILVDGVNVMTTSQAKTYTVTVKVTSSTTITAVYGAPQVILTYEYTGSGYIEVWSSDSYNEGDEETTPVTPAGYQYNMWDEVGETGVCIFVFPMNGASLISLTINDEEQDLDADLAEYGDIYIEDPSEPIHIVATFDGVGNGVESAEAAAINV